MPRIMQNTGRRSSFTMPILSTQDRSKLLFRNIRKIHEIVWNNLVYPSHEQDKRDYISALCEDIMIGIFIRLPVEDVWACKFVCGSWYRIISSRNFVEDHLRSATHATVALIGTVKSFTFSCTNLVVVDHQSNTSKFEKFMEGLLGRQDFALRASCNGLVLIRDIESSRSMLYNPTTKELCNLILSSDSYVLGFFRDEYTNDNKEYKLLMYSFKGRRTSYDLIGLRTKLWTRLCMSRFSPANESVHVGSNVFWMVRFIRPENKYPTILQLCSKCIMVFELDTERLYVMPHPGEVCVPKEDNHDHDKIRLWKMEGRLAFTKLFSQQIYYKINIWVLEDVVYQSWVKFYEIDLTTIGLDLEDYPVEVVNIFDGELLLRWADHLYTYNLQSNAVRSTGTLRSLGYSKENLLHFGSRLTYVKSLISPKSVLAL